MDTRQKIAPRSYEDFEPSFEWIREEGSATLAVSLPGFKKEQIKVQMDNFGNLRVSGERPLTEDRWRRFRKDFRIPENTNNRDAHARFQNATLYVILPKLFGSQAPDQTIRAQAPESRRKTTTEPESREGRDHVSQKDGPPPSGKSDSVIPKLPNGKSGEKGLQQDQREEAIETESSKKAAMEAEPKEDQNRKSQKDGSPFSDAATKQPNGKTGDKDEPADATVNAPSIQDKFTEQIHEHEDTGDSDSESPKSRRRKTEVKDETFYGARRWVDAKLGGLGMKIKKRRQLVLNVGVAIVMLAGISFYVSYKLRKSIEAENNYEY